MKRTITLFGAVALLFTASPITFASFNDVPASHPNYEAINYVQSKGVVEGYPDGTYQPDKLISRYEFTKIIIGATFSKADIDACVSSPFGDVPTGQWFTPYVCVAQKNGVVGGYPDGTFQGTNQINLVEAAKIIVNGFKYPVGTDTIWYKPYILKLEELKALPTTLTGFNHQITRGEMAEVIDRLMEKIFSKTSTTYDNLAGGTTNNANAINTDEEAYAYYQKIRNIDIEVRNDYNAYIDFHDSNIESGNYDEIELRGQETLQFLKNEKSKALLLGKYKDDASLFNALITNLDAKIKVFEGEEVDLIALEKEYDSIKSNLSIEENNQYVQQINDLTDTMVGKVITANQMLRRVYDGFSLNYKFYDDPLEYGNLIIDLFEEVIYEYGTYNEEANQVILNANSSNEISALEAQRKETLSQIQGIKNKVLLSTDGYGGDFSFQDAVIDSIDMTLKLLNNEDMQLNQLWIKILDNGIATDEDANKESELVDAINSKRDVAMQKYNEAKDFFSKKYAIEFPAK